MIIAGFQTLSTYATGLFLLETFSGPNSSFFGGPQWEYGPARAAQCEIGTDPGFDVTGTADERIAGVRIGGCTDGGVNHTWHWLTSPSVSCADAPNVVMKHYQWLSSDALPSMQARIEVYNGSDWVTLFATDENVYEDYEAWVLVFNDLTPYRNDALRVRFGYMNVNGRSAASWNLDDIGIYSNVLSTEFTWMISVPDGSRLESFYVECYSHVDSWTIVDGEIDAGTPSVMRATPRVIAYTNTSAHVGWTGLDLLNGTHTLTMYLRGGDWQPANSVIRTVEVGGSLPEMVDGQGPVLVPMITENHTAYPASARLTIAGDYFVSPFGPTQLRIWQDAGPVRCVETIVVSARAMVCSLNATGIVDGSVYAQITANGYASEETHVATIDLQLQSPVSATLTATPTSTAGAASGSTTSQYATSSSMLFDPVDSSACCSDQFVIAGTDGEPLFTVDADSRTCQCSGVHQALGGAVIGSQGTAMRSRRFLLHHVGAVGNDNTTVGTVTQQVSWGVTYPDPAKLTFTTTGSSSAVSSAVFVLSVSSPGPTGGTLSVFRVDRLGAGWNDTGLVANIAITESF